MDIKTALHAATITFTQSGSDTPRSDAEILLSHALSKPRSHLRTWPDYALTETEQNHFQLLITRRQQGEPIAYILGRKEFWSLELIVSPATLIPRPETELLVELALEKIPQDQATSVLDLGTGSGAIAIAIAHERPRSHVSAVDISSEALAIAEHNRVKHQLSNLQLHHSRWFDSLDPTQRFDVIVSNPPYVAPGDPHLSQGDLRFEPPQALSTASHGLADLFHIAEQARHFLKPGGWLFMEHGYDQSQVLVNKLTELGYRDVIDHRDLGAQPRTICGAYTPSDQS